MKKKIMAFPGAMPKQEQKHFRPDPPRRDYVQIPLPGDLIPRFKEQLPELQVVDLSGQAEPGVDERRIVIEETAVRVLPDRFTPPDAKRPQRTWVWRYRDTEAPLPRSASYIGPLIVAERGRPLLVQWKNTLGRGDESQVRFWSDAVDQTLHWANVNRNEHLPLCGEEPQCPNAEGESSARCERYGGLVPIVTHLHGGENRPAFDGNPDSWYTNAERHEYVVGPEFAGNRYRYENTQQAAPLWFHDHTLGLTRLNVYAGLAGAYLLTDPRKRALPAGLTQTGLDRRGGRHTTTPTIPLVLQDRRFDTRGQLYFPSGENPNDEEQPPNPCFHPRWIGEFIGDTIVVNGKSWPTVGSKENPLAAARYRFLLLNGSNARTYHLWLSDADDPTVIGPPIWVIGTDGGYLDVPVRVQRNPLDERSGLLIQPGERCDIIIDFDDHNNWDRCCHSKRPRQWILRNDAPTPFSNEYGEEAQRVLESPVGELVKFFVERNQRHPDRFYDPASGKSLRPLDPIERLALPNGSLNPALTVPLPGGAQTQVSRIRVLTLNEALLEPSPCDSTLPGGPVLLTINNTKWFPDAQSPDLDGQFVPQDALFTEQPQERFTEVWSLVNLTEDAHPIHLHLVDFQLLNRQAFDVDAYSARYNAAFTGAVGELPLNLLGCGPPGQEQFGQPYTEFTALNLCNRYQFPSTVDAQTGATVVGGNPDVTPFLIGPVQPAEPYEQGWKDTVVANPGQVTRIVVRFSPIESRITAGQLPPPYAIDVSQRPGYTWHCHILDHEDNEFMRRYRVLQEPQGPCQ
jgi:FtsP/CotA-like multicopper oxidase with cupredoxin domain